MVSVKLRLSSRKRVLHGITESELLLRMSTDREHCFRAKTGIFVPCGLWDEAKQRLKISRMKTKENSQLVLLQDKINSLIASITDTAILTPAIKQSKAWLERLIAVETTGVAPAAIIPPVGTSVKKARVSKPQSGTFFDSMDAFIKAQCVGLRITHFNSLKRILMRFEAYLGKGHKLTLDSLTAETLGELKTFLEIEHTFFDDKGKCIKHKNIYNKENLIQIPKPRGGNAVHSLLKKLRTFILWAVKMKKTSNNPFATFKLKACVYGTPFFLTSEERNKLYAYQFESKSLAVQRDIFVFQSNVGMRYGDLCDLTRKNVVNDAIEYVANKTRTKTGKTVRVPLTAQAKEILVKYKDYTGIELLPFISQQKYNDAIKEMLKEAGIDRIVTVINPTTMQEEQHPIYEVASSHMGRRNFIGNLYSKTQDPNTIGSMTGHTDNSLAFARYRAIDDTIKKTLVDQL